jgi:Ca2+-transporting ATPase
MAFATIALAELVLVFALRSTRAPAWCGPPNAALTWSVVASALLVAFLVYIPQLHEPFGTHPLGAAEFAVVAMLALLPAGLVEAAKAVGRTRRSAKDP